MLNNFERETIITFNEAKQAAHIFTYNKRWIKHLEGKHGLNPVMKNTHGGKEYVIDKKRIPLPRAPRKLSPETRKQLANGLAARRLCSGNLVITGKSEKKKVGK